MLITPSLGIFTKKQYYFSIHSREITKEEINTNMKLLNIDNESFSISEGTRFAVRVTCCEDMKKRIENIFKTTLDEDVALEPQNK